MRRVIVVAAAVLTLVLGACGQSSSRSPSTTSPGEPSGPLASAASEPPEASASPATSSAGSSPATSSIAGRPTPVALSVTLAPFVTIPGHPLAMIQVPGSERRFFVASQDGRVFIVRNTAVLPELLIDLRKRVSTGGEQGLLGIALHPRFPDDPRVFVDYTDTSGNTVVSSFRVDPATPDRLLGTAEQVVLTVEQPYENHNGGALVFGPDGDLYVSLGDGGGAGDPHGNGQSTSTLLGKILRLDVDHAPSGKQYASPADNPFVGQGSARPEIWLYGLRNPWRISFDRATGDLWIGDVGQSAWEEIDVVRAGQKSLNFGWNVREGAHCFKPPNGCSTNGLVDPVAEYGHDQGCTVIGGYVYRGRAQAVLTGTYLFADYCSGRVFGIPAGLTQPMAPSRVGTFGAGIVSFAEDADGELYAIDSAGPISRVVAKSP